MNVALISPYSHGPGRGNITTVNRIARFLGEAGCEAAIFPVDSCSARELQERVRRFAPAIVHAFHAGICGNTACRLAADLGAAPLITITGSDMFDEAQRCRPETANALRRAAAVVCFDELVAAETATFFPELAGRLRIIPQGVEQLASAGPALSELTEDVFVVLFPAALRPVKNLECALRAMPLLARQLTRLKLVIAGGAIDPDYAGNIMAQIENTADVIALGDVSRERMGALYARSDLVINCSRFEGGMANSLLEAMALGRGGLVADIPGNRALVCEGQTGWLYRGDDEFVDKLVWLARHPAERRAVGQQAREMVLERFQPQQEAERYLALYNLLVRKEG